MLSFLQTDGWTDRQTTVKQYAPDLSMRGHKKKIFQMDDNVLGKGWSPFFSPLPKIFSKLLFRKVIKTLDCVVKGQRLNLFE